MAFIINYVDQLSAIKKGGSDSDSAKLALEAGGNVNDHPSQFCPLIVSAIVSDRVGMANVSPKQGADPDKPFARGLSCSTPVVVVAMAVMTGERALHIRSGQGRESRNRSLAAERVARRSQRHRRRR